MIVQDLGTEPKQVKVFASNPMRKTETLMLNQRGEHGELTNTVSMVNRRVVLADITQSPGYRAQLLDRLMQVAQTVPDNIKLILLGEILELSELPRKEELIKKIQSAIGMNTNPEDMSEEERAAQAEQQQAQRMALAVEMEMQRAQAADVAASAALKQSQATLNEERVKTETANRRLTLTRAEEILQRIEGMAQDQHLSEREQGLDMKLKLEQQLQDLLKQLPTA